MSVNTTNVMEIKRPKLLMSAAKELILRWKFFGTEHQMIPTSDFVKLMDREAKLEAVRNQKQGDYRAERHIELLALIIEQVTLMTGRIGRA